MPDHLRVPVSRRGGALALCLVLGLLLALPAPAAAGDDLNLSLCKQILSRMLCKKTNEFAYVGKVDEGVYVISVFYASKQSELLCAVMPDGQVVVQDRTWRAMRRVVPYTVSPDGKCLHANYSSPDCPVRKPITACLPKGPQDAKEQQKETFWNRPIPSILEEEYKAMSARDQQNATPAPAPAGNGEK